MNALPVIQETARCTGHCCRSFYLPFSPVEIKQHYYATLYREAGNSLEPDEGQYLVDFETIGDMVIPLGYHERNPLFGDEAEVDGPDGAAWFYTCRHYRDGDCSIYDKRPAMCEDYPYELECDYRDCTRTVETAHGEGEDARVPGGNPC